MLEPIFVIVDGYSTGRYYVLHLNELGYRCVHVQTLTTLPRYIADHLHEEYYLENIYADTLESVVSRLKKYNIRAIIAGSEPGVEFTDQLAAAFDLVINDPALSVARRDKYQMIERIRACGLKTAKQIKTNDIKELYSWVDAVNERPIVIKPIKGTGTEGVTFCYTKNEMRRAMDKLLQQTTLIGEKNVELLAQTFLEGTEYVINTISYRGKHYLCDIWQYKKILVAEAGLIYDYCKILPFDFVHRESLVAYTFRVLDALGVREGASHAEVMLTADGPVIVEVGARVMGAISPDYITKAIGRSQLDLVIDSYLDPERFLQELSTPYKIKNHMMLKLLVSYQSGIIKEIHYLDKIKSLSSCKHITMLIGPNDYLDKTIDLFTSPGHIILMNEDENMLMEDYEKICKYEKLMFEVV